MDNSIPEMNQAGAEEVTQPGKCFVKKCENLSLDVQTHTKIQAQWCMTVTPMLKKKTETCAGQPV